MFIFNRLTAVLVIAALLGPTLPLSAQTRHGDKYLADGRAHEAKKEWDAALDSYEKALSEDPADLVYQMATEKARFQAGQVHIDNGLKLRAQGPAHRGPGRVSESVTPSILLPPSPCRKPSSPAT